MNKNSLNFNKVIDDDKVNLQLKIKQLYNIIEFSYDGIYITDGDANTIFLNKAYEKITGLKKEEMLGINMNSIVKYGYISESATLSVIKTGKSITIEQKFKTGKKAIVSSTPIFDDKGNVSMIVTNVRDITELHRLRKKLQINEQLAKKYYSQVKAIKKHLMNFPDIIAVDKKMLNVLGIAKKVSEVNATILLLGETGVGKEEIAKYIYKNSEKNNKSFIKINCGAIPENLIESELFGYEKGSFTGANKEGKIGLFELADRGTIFLDEVGELPLDLQVKLLRVLQESEITRVGGTNSIKVDVRIIAATNRNLEEMVARKTFREDLYYRLNVIPITIPPLRNRKEDIEPLTLHFIRLFNKKYNFNKFITNEAIEVLKEYEWPGNVRELKNIIERIAIMSTENKIFSSDLKLNVRKSEISITDNNLTLNEAVEKLEATLIRNVFEKHGNVRTAAKELGITASTFVRKRKRYKSKNLL